VVVGEWVLSKWGSIAKKTVGGDGEQIRKYFRQDKLVVAITSWEGTAEIGTIRQGARFIVYFATVYLWTTQQRSGADFS
jgi:hypothetical protein